MCYTNGIFSRPLTSHPFDHFFTPSQCERDNCCVVLPKNSSHFLFFVFSKKNSKSGICLLASTPIVLVSFSSSWNDRRSRIPLACDRFWSGTGLTGYHQVSIRPQLFSTLHKGFGSFLSFPRIHQSPCRQIVWYDGMLCCCM